jgi:thermolabile hemolysin
MSPPVVRRRQTLKRLSAWLLAIALLVPGAAPSTGFTISQVVVFGDSNVDDGARNERRGLPDRPLPPNIGGRRCNGPVVVEYLAAGLRVPLLDFARSGATTGQPDRRIGVPNALQQVQSFVKTLEGRRANPNAIFVYWAGSNDIRLATTPPEALAGKIAGAVGNIEAAVRQLDLLGARRIIVATRTPRPDLAGVDNQNGIALNAAIKAAVARLAPAVTARVEVFDAYSSIEHMMLNPQDYGFTQPTALCIENNAGPGTCATDASVGARYVHWDASHKTTRVHEIMAQQMALQIKSGAHVEPGARHRGAAPMTLSR